MVSSIVLLAYYLRKNKNGEYIWDTVGAKLKTIWAENQLENVAHNEYVPAGLFGQLESQIWSVALTPHLSVVQAIGVILLAVRNAQTSQQPSEVVVIDVLWVVIAFVYTLVATCSGCPDCFTQFNDSTVNITERLIEVDATILFVQVEGLVRVYTNMLSVLQLLSHACLVIATQLYVIPVSTSVR